MSVPPALVGWLVTYALHSTILLGFVLLVSSRLGSDAWRETLWKTALVGGLLTATLQGAAGYTPLVGRWVLRNDVASPPPAHASGRQPEARDLAATAHQEGVRLGRAARAAGRRVADVRQEPTPPVGGGAQARLANEAAPGAGIPWVALVMAAWVAVAALLLGRLALQHFWLSRVLAGRRLLSEGPVPEMLAALCRQTGSWSRVRLTVSAACPTPIALGRSEICLPERFLTDLGPDEQRSALAHELAHLRRRDPLWQFTAGIMECVFFFQPLNRVARQHLRDAAENLSDDWAVRHTGSALGLARCLADVASWISATTIPRATLAMAEDGPPLVRRIERLTQWREPSTFASRLRPLAPFVLLALVAWVAPAASQPGSERWAWTGRLAEGQAIEVKGAIGSIRAMAASGDQIEVVAERRSRRREAHRVEMRVVEHEDGVTICALYPTPSGAPKNECLPGDEGRMGALGANVEVDFTVRVPSHIALGARTGVGNIDVRGLLRDVHANTGAGDISISTEGAASARTVAGSIRASMGARRLLRDLKFETMSGDITLELPRSLDADLLLRASETMELTLPMGVRDGSTAARMRGRLGAGGPEISASTTQGTIRLRPRP